MAFENTLSITYDGVVKNLVRVDDGNYSSTYRLDEPANFRKFELRINHFLPKTQGGPNELHNVKLDVLHFNADNVLTHTSSTWGSIKTFLGAQNSTDSENCADALVGLLTPAFIARVASQES